MAAVVRLLTFVDIADEDDDGPAARRMSVAVRHEAVLPDGRRVVLLRDRGWSEQVRVVSDDEPSEQERRLAELPGIWAYATVEDMARTARDVVGPDEPFAGHSRRTRTPPTGTRWRKPSGSRAWISRPPSCEGCRTKSG